MCFLFHIIIRVIIVINKLQFIFFTWNRSLPDVVISHVAQFLSPGDLGNMRRVNRYFRQLFSSPHVWQGIRISMPRFSTKHGQLRIDLSILETIKLRGIKELELRDFDRCVNNDLRNHYLNLRSCHYLSWPFPCTEYCFRPLQVAISM